MPGADTSGTRERLAAGVAKALAKLPDRPARLLAGRPVRRDGQQLDVHVQLALRLERFVGGWEPLPAPAARARRRSDAAVFRGPVIEIGSRARPRAARPRGSDPGPPL